MTIRPLLLCLLVSGCAGNPPLADTPMRDLDFVEINDASGWRLRIHGDGGGSLSHKQLPAYHLHYPAQTFVGGPGRGLTERCRGTVSSPVCVRLRYYDAATDRTLRCDCAPGDWAETTVEQAIADMPLAVEAGGDERSCRMLRRRWLAAR